MKILIVGYGSMGRRRMRLALEILEGAEFVCVDSSRERLGQAEAAGAEGRGSLAEGIRERPDIAFVCTSPGGHADIIMRLVGAGIHVFTELNLTDRNYGEILSLSKEKEVTVFMSSTMLYNKQIERISGLVKRQKKPLTYIYHVGQYLPDWHPWESYRDFFAGRKETNGVREILAVQLPWIIDAFGSVESLYAGRQRCTDLDLDFPDSIQVNFRHGTGHMGVFVADIVSRKATAGLEVIGEDLHLFWNGHNDGLRVYDIEGRQMKNIYAYEKTEHAEGYADNIAEDPYRDEIKEFLEAVSSGKTPRYSLEKDAYVLSVIDEIERGGR